MKRKPRNPGGRPKSFERDAVLDAAVLVFWERGYEGASLDDLTRAMGINRPSLYATFGNKHGLFLEALDRYVSVQGKVQSEPLRNEADIKSAVEGYYNEIIRTVKSPSGPCGCLIACVASEVAERDEIVRKKIAANLRRSEDFLNHRLKQADVNAQNMPPLTGALILSAGMSLAQRARLGASTEELRAVAGGYIDHFFHAKTKSA